MTENGPGSNVNHPVGFGVIGANSLVANAAVLPAIDAAPNARLVATASRSSDVPTRWGATDVGSYEAVLDHPAVEAVYIPLPNGMHREWTEKAAAAGKHVLCEKPLASDVTTARAMAGACRSAGVLLAEAWMTPFSRRYAHVIGDTGRLGAVDRIETEFTFTIGSDASDNYRWDLDQGGGALLDVGIYCLGPIVEIFGPDPLGIAAEQRMTAGGVDASTTAELVWADGRSASIHCSFVDDEAQILRVCGSAGHHVIAHEAFTGGVDADSFEQTLDEGETHRIAVADPNDPYQSMVEEFADAVRGETQWPRPVERTIELLALIERVTRAAHA